MGVLGILRKDTFSCGLTWMSWAWLPACDHVDFVAVFEEFVGEVVDVGACASCERPILGRDEADLRRHHLRLPVRYLRVVAVAPTNQAARPHKIKHNQPKSDCVVEFDGDFGGAIDEVEKHEGQNQA